MSRIRVNIGKLTLHGFDAADGHTVAQALKREMARIVADPAGRADWGGSHRTPVVRIGPMPIEASGAGSRKFAAALARAIGRRLKP